MRRDLVRQLETFARPAIAFVRGDSRTCRHQTPSIRCTAESAVAASCFRRFAGDLRLREPRSRATDVDPGIMPHSRRLIFNVPVDQNRSAQTWCSTSCRTRGASRLRPSLARLAGVSSLMASFNPQDFGFDDPPPRPTTPPVRRGFLVVLVRPLPGRAGRLRRSLRRRADQLRLGSGACSSRLRGAGQARQGRDRQSRVRAVSDGDQRRVSGGRQRPVVSPAARG